VSRATLRVGDAAAIAVAWVDASKLLVGDRAGRVTLQSLDGAAEPVGSDGSPVWAVAVSGSTLIWGGSDGVVHERRGASTREVAQEASGIFSLAAGSESALAVGTGNGSVRVFGGEEQTLRGLTDDVLAVASAPVGATGFAACSRDGEANVWDDSGHLIAQMSARKGGAMNDIAWPGLDQVVTASDDGVVRVWYVPGGDPAHAWPKANGSLRAIAVSPKSGLLADAGAAGDVRLSSPRGEVIKRLAVAAGAVWDLSWSPAGDVLAAACNDGTIRLLGLPD
jgi:WD40 repeat protein